MIKNTIILFFLIIANSAFSQNCSVGIVAPHTQNGIVMTSVLTGSAILYSGTSTMAGCGFTFPTQGYSIGALGTYSITFSFSQPIGQITMSIIGAGTISQGGGASSGNEVFSFITNTGVPSITNHTSCFTSVSGPVITSGLGSTIATFGGGIHFTVSNSIPFTSLTISGLGGHDGSGLAICDYSAMNSAFHTADTLVICSGDSVFLENRFVKTPGSYVDSLTSSSGLDSIVTTTLIVKNSPSFVLNSIPVQVCVGDQILFQNSSTSIDSILTYRWDFGDGTMLLDTFGMVYHSYSTAGNKTISLSSLSQLGCGFDTSFVVSVNKAPDADFVFDTVCDGSLTNVSSQNINMFSWEFVMVDTSILSSSFSRILSNLSSVKHIVIDSNGCKDSITKNITTHPKPIISVSYPSEIPSEYAIACITNNTTFADYYFWRFGVDSSIAISPCIDFFGKTGINEVKLIASNQFGCLDSLLIEINVLEPVNTTFMPNSFTPNDDSYNDIFKPYFSGNLSYDLQIFNRWGDLLYEGRETDEGWDGTFEDAKVMEGIYVYKLLVKKPDGIIQEIFGHVTLTY
ncbi:MAG: T9SS type B sorting domain-containing protein [Flavobacteriales bacterium]